LDWGADTDCKTLLGETACHLAAYRGHTDVVRHLLAAGCDWTWRNWRGNNVVDEALSAVDRRSTVAAALVLSTAAESTSSSSPDTTAAGTTVAADVEITSSVAATVHDNTGLVSRTS